MAAAASYGRPLDGVGSAGPSARPFSPTKSSARKQEHQASRGKDEKKPVSPSKKKVQLKKNRLPEVGPTIQDIENGVVHITGKLLGQVSRGGIHSQPRQS